MVRDFGFCSIRPTFCCSLFVCVFRIIVDGVALCIVEIGSIQIPRCFLFIIFLAFYVFFFSKIDVNFLLLQVI